MSIMTGSNSANMAASSTIATQPIVVAEQVKMEISNRTEIDGGRLHHKGDLKVEHMNGINDEPNLKRLKDDTASIDSNSKVIGSIKAQASIDCEMESNAEFKLTRPTIHLGTLQKSQNQPKQSFIVTGHIINQESSSKEIQTKLNNSITQKNPTKSNQSQNVVKSNSNSNLWKIYSNHMVKIETSNQNLSRIPNLSSNNSNAKKLFSSRPDLVASSISALHSTNNKGLLRTDLSLNNDISHNTQSNTDKSVSIQQSQLVHSYTKSERDCKLSNKSNETRSVTTKLPSQLILSSIITSRPSFETRRATGSDNVSGLQFCLGTTKEHIPCPDIINSSTAIPATINACKASSSETLNVKMSPISSPINSAKIKSTRLTSNDDSLSAENVPTLGTTLPAGNGNVVAARLLDLGKRLLEATKEGNTNLVRELVVESGAPFTSDWLGTTALHIAAQNGFSDIAEILIHGGVNKDARTKLERTALHLASQSGCLDVVDLLINNGCDVNCRDMLKMTPLHWAVERGHVCVVERLLTANADFTIESKFKLTPLDIAKNSGSYDVIQLFKVSITCLPTAKLSSSSNKID